MFSGDTDDNSSHTFKIYKIDKDGNLSSNSLPKDKIKKKFKLKSIVEEPLKSARLPRALPKSKKIYSQSLELKATDRL